MLGTHCQLLLESNAEGASRGARESWPLSGAGRAEGAACPPPCWWVSQPSHRPAASRRGTSVGRGTHHSTSSSPGEASRALFWSLELSTPQPERTSASPLQQAGPCFTRRGSPSGATESKPQPLLLDARPAPRALLPGFCQQKFA